MYDEYHFTHDSAVVSLDETCDAVVEEDGEQTIDWDEVEQVRVDDPPYAEAFDTERFYKLPVTAARPINQKYHYGSADDDDSGLVTLRKPRSELKQAAWSLDRRPITLGHPDTRMVKTMDDIHGFWSDVNYVDSVDNLDANGYVPVGDEEAQGWIEDNTDVSIGFHHKVTKVDEYDGTIGGTDAVEDVDGLQTDLYMNHCAFVGTGRCSDEDGCGLDSASPHGSTRTVDSLKRSGTIINEGGEDTDMEETVDQPSGIYEGDEGGLYGVAPGENGEETPKYPMDNCSDVSDAWKLRGHGEYTIEQSTLETRIKRMADYHDCDMSFGEDDSVSAIDRLGVAGRYDIMPCDCADCNCENESTNDTMTEFDIDINDLSAEAALDKLGESHEGIADLSSDVAEMREQVDMAESVADSLDTDLTGLDERVDEVATKAEKYDEMIDEKMTEKAERIAEIVDKYDEAESVIDKHDGDYESISDELDVLESAIETESDETDESETSQTTVDSGSGGDEPEQKTRVEPDAWG